MSCIVILSVSVSVLLHQICLAEGPLCYVALIVLIVVLFCVSRVVCLAEGPLLHVKALFG